MIELVVVEDLVENTVVKMKWVLCSLVSVTAAVAAWQIGLMEGPRVDI